MALSRNGVPLSSEPLISIVIITRNEGAELAATVASFLETLPAGRREIVVVDDGSTDDSTAFLTAHPEVRVVRSEGIGVARARNLGASFSSGEVVLFADAHVRAPAGWLPPLVAALRDESVGAVAPGIYNLSEPSQRGFGLALSGANLHARWLRRSGPDPCAVPVLPGCFLAMRREVFRRTGGYDEAMRQLGGNDNEFSCRLWLLGYQLLVVTEIEVGHLFRTKAPYEALWASVVHNRLRMAFVHFESVRIERVVDALRGYRDFPAAIAMMLHSGDVFARRALLTETRTYSDDWYCQKFGLPF